MPMLAVYLIAGGVFLGGGTYALTEGSKTALRTVVVGGIVFYLIKKVK
jgi:hypothetical protein